MQVLSQEVLRLLCHSKELHLLILECLWGNDISDGSIALLLRRRLQFNQSVKAAHIKETLIDEREVSCNDAYRSVRKLFNFVKQPAGNSLTLHLLNHRAWLVRAK